MISWAEAWAHLPRTSKLTTSRNRPKRRTMSSIEKIKDKLVQKVCSTWMSQNHSVHLLKAGKLVRLGRVVSIWGICEEASNHMFFNHNNGFQKILRTGTPKRECSSTTLWEQTMPNHWQRTESCSMVNNSMKWPYNCRSGYGSNKSVTMFSLWRVAITIEDH